MWDWQHWKEEIKKTCEISVVDVFQVETISVKDIFKCRNTEKNNEVLHNAGSQENGITVHCGLNPMQC